MLIMSLYEHESESDTDTSEGDVRGVRCMSVGPSRCMRLPYISSC